MEDLVVSVAPVSAISTEGKLETFGEMMATRIHSTYNGKWRGCNSNRSDTASELQVVE